MTDYQLSRPRGSWGRRWRGSAWGLSCALAFSSAAWATTLFQTSQVASGGQTVAGSSTLQPAGAVTIEAWINASAAQTNYAAFVSYGIDTTPYESYILQAQDVNGTKPADFYFVTGTGQGHQVYGTTLLQTGTQYFLTATYDGTTAKIYVNGQLQNSLAVTGSLYYPSGSGLGLARKYIDTSSNFTGTELGVAIYDTALTAAQILAQYQATSPPTIPTSLTATAASSTQVNLSWTGSSDDVSVASYSVERCQGSGCTSFAQVGTPTGTTFNDTGLAASTNYSYRVRALDGSGNYSNYSSTVTASTQAGSGGSGPTPVFQLSPVAAGGQTLAASSTLQPATAITVAAWVKATGATTNYPAFVSYGVDTTPYESYIIQAQNINGAKPFDFYFVTGTGTGHDVFGSTLLQVGTQYLLAATYDGTTANLYVNGQLDKSAAVSGVLYYPSGGGLGLGRKYSVTTDNFSGNEAGASIYGSALTAAQILALYQGGPPSGSPAPTVPNGYAGSVTYTYDMVGRLNSAAYNNAASVTYSLDAVGNRKVVTTPDTTAPTAPGTPTFSNVIATGATVAWAASVDNVGVASYEYQINSGGWVNVGNALTANLTGLVPLTSYSISVHSIDAAGNASAASSATLTTVGDTTPPTFTGALTFSSIAVASATVSWPAASDNVGVASYEYQVNGGATWTNVGNVLNTSVTGLHVATSYTIGVRARDAAGNPSGVLSGSFTTPSDTIPPGPPGTPGISNAVYNGATATWTAASDNVGVTSYQYEVNLNGTPVINWTSIGNVLTYSFTGVAPSTTYTFSIRALDAALNAGPATTSAAFTTAADTTAPLPPGVPTFSAITDHSATVTWTAASDNVGVTNYQIQVGASGSWVSVGNVLSTPISGLTPSAAYTVSIRGVDGAGNLGAPSSAPLTVGPDATPPSAPGTPVVNSIVYTSVTISWVAATDNVGVTNYAYQLNGGAWISVGNVLSTTISGLNALTSYTVAVRASDARNNVGVASGSTSFTTGLYGDTPVITIGGDVTSRVGGGYRSGAYGSITPGTTTNGYTYVNIYSATSAGSGPGGGGGSGPYTIVGISGFSADPGQSWLTSVTCAGGTATASSATYAVVQGVSTWTWDSLVFNFSGTTATCTVVHK